MITSIKFEFDEFPIESTNFQEFDIPVEIELIYELAEEILFSSRIAQDRFYGPSPENSTRDTDLESEARPEPPRS